MKPSRPRSFSSTGKVSRTGLLAGVTLAAAAAVTAVVVARASTGDQNAEAASTGHSIAAAASSWRSAETHGCPTLTRLIEDGRLSRTARTDDPWGNRFRVVCEGDETSVRSAGPDRREGTTDDVTVKSGGV